MDIRLHRTVRLRLSDEPAQVELLGAAFPSLAEYILYVVLYELDPLPAGASTIRVIPPLTIRMASLEKGAGIF